MPDLKLFALDAQSGTYVENTENGMWTFDWFDHATTDRPDFLAATSGRFGTSAKLTKGQLNYPNDGFFPRDKFRIEFRLKCEGADFTAVGGPGGIFRFGDNTRGNGQDVFVGKDSGELAVEFTANELQFVGGSKRQIKVRFTPSVGLFPSNTEVPVTIEYDGTFVRVYVSDVLKGTSLASAVVPFFRFPLSGDARGFAGDFHITGDDGTLSGASSLFTVSDIDVYPFLRLSVAEASVTTRAVTVNASATVGTWDPKSMGGVVAHYYDDASVGANNGVDGHPANRDATLNLYQSAGPNGSLGLVREAIDFSVMAPPTMSGGPSGTITSIDFSKWHAYWDNFNSRGAKCHLWFGYTPAALRTGGTVASPPDSNTVYADYCSRILTDFKARYGVSAIGAVSVWNEPESGSFWSGTLAQFKSLWLAIAQKLANDHPDVVLGTSDSGSGQGPVGGAPDQGDPFIQGCIDQAAANNLPCPIIHLHTYTSAMSLARGAVRYFTVYAQQYAAAHPGKGYDNPRVMVTEWNYSIGYQGNESAANTTWATVQRRMGRTHSAAYEHAFLAGLVEAGNVDAAAMFTMGCMSGWENGAIVDDRQVPVLERPSFSLLRLLWKHGPSRLRLSVTPRDTLQVIATSGGAGGRIMLTYSFYRPWRPADALSTTIAWSGLPSKFTWTQYKIDSSTETLYTAVPSPGSYAKGALATVATGNQTNLPTTLTSQALSVGAIEILPANRTEGLIFGN